MRDKMTMTWIGVGALLLGVGCSTTGSGGTGGTAASAPEPGTRSFYEQKIRGAYALDGGKLVRIATNRIYAPALGFSGPAGLSPMAPASAQTIEGRVLQVLSANLVLLGKPTTNDSGVIAFPRSCVVATATNRLSAAGEWLRLPAVADGTYDFVTGSGIRGRIPAYREVVGPTFEEYRLIYERDCKAESAGPLVSAVPAPDGVYSPSSAGAARAPSNELPQAPDIIAEADKGSNDLLRLELVALFTTGDGATRLIVREPGTNSLRVLDSAALPVAAAVLAVDEVKAVVVLGRGPRAGLLDAVRACEPVMVQPWSEQVAARDGKRSDVEGKDVRLISMRFQNCPLEMVMDRLAELAGQGLLWHSSSPHGNFTCRTQVRLSVGESAAILIAALSSHHLAVDLMGDSDGGFLVLRSASDPSLAAKRPFALRWPLGNTPAQEGEKNVVKFERAPLKEVLKLYLNLHREQVSASVVSNLLWQAELFSGDASCRSSEAGLPAEVAAYGLERILEWNAVELLFDGSNLVGMRQNKSTPSLPRVSPIPSYIPARRAQMGTTNVMSAEAMREYYRQKNVELIRAQGKKGPPPPIPLTPETDAELVKEGVLPPL